MNQQKIYFAGGCFWGMQKLFQNLPGILHTETGYANGKENIIPDYKTVCKGDTEFKECVLVEYDRNQITLPQLLKAFFFVVDPTQKNRQANDIGTQYQTGIYYVNEIDRTIIEQYVESIRSNYPAFETEVGPLSNFYTAEEYHQNYLINNPTGYCHIPTIKYEEVKKIIEE